VQKEEDLVLKCINMIYSTVQALQSFYCMSVAHQQTEQAPFQRDCVMPAVCELCYLMTGLCVLGKMHAAFCVHSIAVPESLAMVGAL